MGSAIPPPAQKKASPDPNERGEGPEEESKFVLEAA